MPSPEAMRFKDPFGNGVGGRGGVEGEGGGRTIQDVLRGVYAAKGGGGRGEGEQGESMLRGGSDRLGKGVGVWRVE